MRENARAGVQRLEPSFWGKLYNSMNKHVQFLMKARAEEDWPFDMESSMRMATDVMFTQI